MKWLKFKEALSGEWKCNPLKLSFIYKLISGCHEIKEVEGEAMTITAKASAATNPSGRMIQGMNRGMKHGPMSRERPVINTIHVEIIQINFMSLEIGTRKMIEIFHIRITHQMCWRIFHTIIKMISVLFTWIFRDLWIMWDWWAVTIAYE